MAMKNAMGPEYNPKGRDILSEYGRDTPKSQAPVAHSGGGEAAKPMPYSPPQGPTSQYHTGPGLGGENHGQNAGGMQAEPRQTSGSPGIGGTVYYKGSQK